MTVHVTKQAIEPVNIDEIDPHNIFCNAVALDEPASDTCNYLRLNVSSNGVQKILNKKPQVVYMIRESSHCFLHRLQIVA